MIAKVGDDQFGPRLRQGLRAATVNVRAVGIAKATASGVALITVDRDGQNSITVIPGANAKLLPCDLEKSMSQLRAAGMILTQLETPMETVEYLCTLAGRFQVPLMLDPAPARALPRKMLRNVTYLTPNETETCALCDIPTHDLNRATVAELARSLQAQGAANVIIKMGKHGAFVAAAIFGTCTDYR
jgi:ribokinase